MNLYSNVILSRLFPINIQLFIIRGDKMKTKSNYLLDSNYLDANYFNFRNKLFTFKEVVAVCEKVIEEIKSQNTLNNQYNMSLLTANVLNAKPFGFGKKRLTEYFRLFFDQLNYLSFTQEDFELVINTVKNLGLNFDIHKGKLRLRIDE